MPFWIALLISLAFSIVGQLLAPKTAGPKPDEKPQLPETDETRPIPVLWGEWLITNPQLFWWGDYTCVPIKKRIFTGLWFKHITTGFKYNLGMALALCDAGLPNHSLINSRGIEGVTEIQINEKVLWSGNVGQNGTIGIDNPGFFGGNKDGGNGGVKAQIEVHTGDYTPTEVQERSTYLETQLTHTPTWKGLALLVWRGPSAGYGYYGNSPSLQPIAFKAYRRPNLGLLPGVGMGTETFAYLPGTNDANPVHCLLELFLNEDWGMGDITLDDVDVAKWRAAAEVCYNEANGFSYLWDRQTTVEDMAEIILKQIDGVVYTDFATGLLTIKLARADYDVDDLPVYGNDAFIEISNLTRGSWDDTINEVRVQFTDKAQNYKSRSIFDQDLANVTIQQGEGVNTNINYPGCTNEPLARSLGRRDLQVLTQPLLRFTGTIDRTAHDLNPGDPFVFEWPEQGIDAVVMRVTTVRLGTLENGVIELECVEDKFATATALFNTTTSGWTNPVGDPAPVEHGEIAELPYYFQQDDDTRVYPLADRPDASQQSFAVVLEGIVEEESAAFVPWGTLAANMAISYDAYDDTGFTVQDVTDIALVPAGSDGNARSGLTVIKIDDEYMAYRVSSVVSGDVLLDEVYRGLLDTVPQEHTAGASVWFVGANLELIEQSYASGTTVNAEFLTQTVNGILAAVDAPDYSLLVDRRALRPLRPTLMTINGNVTSDSVADTGDIVVVCSERNRLTESPLLTAADTTVTPELLTTYILDIYGESNVLLRRVSGLTTPSYTYTNAFEIVDAGSLQDYLTFEFYSRRDGLNSHQAFTRRVKRTGGVFPGSYPPYNPAADAYVAPAAGSVIAGHPVVGTPTNGQVLVYNSTTGQWVPASATGIAGSLIVEEIDGTPSVSGVTKIKVQNFTLVDEGAGVVRLDSNLDLILTSDGEVLVDLITGEVVYYA